VAKNHRQFAGVRNLFAKAIKDRRRKLGITQDELAWRAGLHRTYITDIERGARNLSLQSIERLARALETPISELFRLAAETGQPANGHPKAGASGNSVDILLVEDNPDDVELTLRAFHLARVKNRVHVVQDGAQALDFLFRRGEFAGSWPASRQLVMLLDLGLPKVSGLEVLRSIRDDARLFALPVVVLTISNRSRDIAECRKLGCSFYIIKPVGFENFSKITPNLQLDWHLTHAAPRADGS
jgi:CheY-like chemotaxis protein/DNA-binding XRE family transcriptional regulator